MEPEQHEDIKIAQAICNDVRNGDITSLNRWFEKYYEELFKFARYQLSRKSKKQKKIKEKPEDILHKFYIELSSGNAFCLYRRKNNCSLKSYIFRRLKYRCIGAVSKSAESADTVSAMSKDDAIEKIPDPGASTEVMLIEKQKHKLLYQALDRLSSDSRTVEDAILLSWSLQEISCDEMAKRLLTSKNMAATDDAIKRESARIRKRMTRPGGSIEKLGDILKPMTGNS